MAPRSLTLLAVLLASSAASASPAEPPVHFEIGLNTRHLGASEPDNSVALRSITDVEDGTPSGTGITVSFRFTKWMRWNTFTGVEAETGTLTTRNSNFAGAYGLFGTRHELGRLALFVEAAAGKRWVRYDIMENNRTTWMVEPRVRAETWLSDRFTLGGAIGSTITGDVRIWMAGLYLGVHSLEFGKR